MYHTLESLSEFTIDLEISPKHPLERLRIRRGTHLRAQLRPHVVERDGVPVEVADLYLEEGTVIRAVPFALFRFVEWP
jgi:hypothetical protein